MPPRTYIVEHLDPELETWSAYEYACIAKECHASGARFFLTSVPTALKLPTELQKLRDEGVLTVETRAVEELWPGEDGKNKVCLLDPKATTELCEEDGDRYEAFLFGGILGDDPPRDRTAELRNKGFPNRRLGPVQMTTDTAVRVTRMITQDKMALDKIPYVDHPEIKVSENESVEMPFRYVKDDKGQPILPDGMLELIKKDSEKGLDDLL